MTSLGSLLAAAGVDANLSPEQAAVPVSTVELDSRRCRAGSVFVCVPGTTTSGDAFVDDALARGAVCVVAATEPRAPILVRVSPEAIRGTLASLSSAIVGDPASELSLTGVTGTNGKTTVAWLVQGILSEAGYAAASIGTLSGQRTTPAPPDLHRELREIADRATATGRPGAVAMEVSSHALDQGRVDGLRFDVAVFTNLSHEHLDYHGTMDAYFEAKAGLFEPARAAAAVVCVDDEWGRRLAARHAVPTVEVSSSDASSVEVGLGRTSFRWRDHPVTTGLTGHVNVIDSLLALSAASVLGVDDAEAAIALSLVPPVPGRLEAVGSGAPRVLVDYAHTPAALQQVLGDLRALDPSARLIVVFGCGGDRDADKRPEMGRVASELADEVIVTSDNPRSEDPEAILDAIVAGATGPARLRRQIDRVAAIAEAIESASSDDVVLIAGKGHETAQEIAGTLVPLDDREVAGAALSAKGLSC
ncbi:MAG TPA: UDP-N-acetylmuramoyl-L-alanyl-D-glutamate--2,6-diaminopimelate ligase [Acidimicrobiales bacterium]